MSQFTSTKRVDAARPTMHGAPARRSLIAWTAVGFLIAMVWVVPSPAASRITLGSHQFAKDVPQYQGAGKVQPKVIGDGNTCEGQASELRWKHWGKRRATATGKMCDSPQGCTSACAQESAAQAVAYDLGRCTPHGPRVYRRAKARVRDVDTGEWSRWSSLNTFGANGRLCHSKFEG